MPSLAGKFYVEHSKGVIIIDFNKPGPAVCLEARSGTFPIYPEPHSREDPQMVLPLYSDLEMIAAELGKNVQKILAILDHFPSDQHALFIFCMRYGASAFSLIKHVPSLAFLLAGRGFYGEQGAQDNIPLMDMKRTDILKLLEFPGTKATVKLFTKIPPKELNHTLLNDLRQVVTRGQDHPGIAKTLAHATRINALFVKILAVEVLWPWVRPTLLYEASGVSLTSSEAEDFSQLSRTKDSLAEAINAGMVMFPLARIKDLGRLHDRLIDWLIDGERREKLKTINFKTPPFLAFTGSGKDAGTITPITSGIALWEEGEKMHHCIAGLAEDIAERQNLYPYHVEVKGESATMMLCRQTSRWSVQEIRGHHNAAVTPFLKSFVKNWLARGNRNLFKQDADELLWAQLTYQFHRFETGVLENECWDHQ